MLDFEQTSAVPFQRTLKTPIHCTGIGLHSGSKVHMTLRPAEAGAGITFVRTDLRGADAVIPASWDHVTDTRLCTVIANEAGASVGTIEHLMAALRGLEVDNVTIEIDSPEVPIMDGSSAPFVFLIECAGLREQTAPRRAIRILRPVGIGDATRGASLTPADRAIYSVEIDFQSAAVARQRGTVTLGPGAFKADVARARTFGFLHEVDQLRQVGLARGGSLDNAIVISGDRVLNEGGLRYEDEFVRHKILDSIGDLYLAGAQIIGHFHGFRCGHALNNQVLHALFANPDAWCWVGDAQTDPTVAAWNEPQRRLAVNA